MAIAIQPQRDPAVAEVARRSMERSAEVYGLDAAGSPLPARLTQPEVQERQQQVDDCLKDAARAICRMASVAERSGCVLLVASPDGVVVHRHSRGGDSERLGSVLDEGSVWTEAFAGNNAVGTALVEEQAVVMHGPDHLLEILHPYSCMAVPLWDGHQQLSGVLDLTTLAAGTRHVPFLQHALEQTAGAVHGALFAQAYPDHCLVELSPNALDPIETSSALLAVAADGKIAGLTRSASKLFALSPSARPTSPIGELISRRFGMDLQAFVDAPAGATLSHASWSLRLARRPASERARAHRSRPAASPVRKKQSLASLDLEALAGEDATMGRHRRAIHHVLETDLPIMLGGETGTGKDAFAKAIHAASRRSSAAFVAVNCASLTEGLLDSELFGYAPGTFTGGLEVGKPGKIEAADGGTLFLDEIGDMPLPLQGRLLRVLAEREVTRLGAITPVPVDIQLITATHRDLGALVKSGGFREDLYYRLRGASFSLPALRDRTDLEALIVRLAPPGTTFAPEARAQLLAYRWPGNIRQLKQVLLFASACSGDGRITLQTLPLEVQGDTPSPTLGLESARQRSERKVLLEALAAHDWNVSKAAAQLGIGRSTAHRKMRQLGIRRPPAAS
ncbi:MAG: sigma-54-dependent Fis family transcriptional regulator [Myxococcota bacterium]